MITEIGHFTLVLALALALVQSVLPLWGAQTGNRRMMAVAGPVAHLQFLAVAAAFAALTLAYIASDFSVENVWQNSHSAKPMLYKITGVWGNHEGSMLLWVLILVLFGSLVALFGGNIPVTLRSTVIAVQGWIGAAFLLFILVTSNPFARIPSPPIEGRDLNPILQDIGLAIHPPLLYLGYVGLSVAFSFAIAALIEGRINAAWARWVRPWTLAAWIFLTLGISMGSYWAYYELGWGGWWFWDPVENASFMPWLAATALLHSAIVMEKRDALKVWTVLLAILSFSLSLLGTFLVRSGVLTSVHTFASNPARGVFILILLIVFIGGALALFAWRAGNLRQGGIFAPISREGALILNNLFLTAACATVLIGTLYPLVLEAVTGDKISVGAPFYNLTFVPLILPVLIAIPFGPFLAWKRGDLAAVSQRLIAALVLSAVIALAVWIWRGDGPSLAPLGIGIGFWLIAGAISEIAWRGGLFRVPLKTALKRLAGLPGSAWGTMIAHAGIGVSVLGIVAVTAWESEKIIVMQTGMTTDLAGYDITYQGTIPRRGPNYQEEIGRFLLSRDGRDLAVMNSAKRLYTARRMPTTEAAIHTIGASQVYISMGDATNDGGLTVRLYHKPWVTLIWIGTLVMVVGGTISLADRRLRVGAPRPARGRLAPAE